MAKKKKGVNKSEAIKKALAKNPNGSPTEVASTLSKKGVEVSAAYVSTVKSTMGGKKTTKGRKKTKKRGKRAGSGDLVSMSRLVEAKRFVESAGGVEKAQESLNAIKKLQ